MVNARIDYLGFFVVPFKNSSGGKPRIVIKILETTKKTNNSVHQLIKVKNGNYIKVNSVFTANPIETAFANGITNTIKAS